ncbi:hypothetical protein BH10BAC2_BH10BAC2_35110 [soil metagenome]
MKLISVLLNLFLIIALGTSAQSPSILWQHTIGGSDNDSLTSLSVTADGGFIACGVSKSPAGFNKSQNPVNASLDYWVVKFDVNGNITWDKTFGGSGIENAPVITQTSDGGYLVNGSSQSDSSANKTENAINRSFDFWAIKIDKNGNIQWDNTIGGIQYESAAAVADVSSGFMLAGIAHSGAGDDITQQNLGSNLWADYWLLKLKKKNGKVLWNRRFGAGNSDILKSIATTPTGNTLLAGYSYSPAEYDKTENFIGNCDFWIIMIDPNGNKLWNKLYGSKFSDFATSIAPTSDGGYIIGGYSNSPAGFNKSGAFVGVTDYWIVKIDSLGNQQWDKTIGGTKGDYLTSIKQTVDNGYLLSGYSSSGISGIKTEAAKGKDDIWLVKLDNTGNFLWDKTLGGDLIDKPSNVIELSNGDLIIGASSNSSASGDKSENTIGGSGKNDFWIMRLTANGGPRSKTAESNAISSVVKNSNTDPGTKSLSMHVSPNPVKTVATVAYAAQKSNSLNLIVYNSNGKVVSKSALKATTGTHTVNLSAFANGVYYFVLTNGKSSYTQAIVKE